MKKITLLAVLGVLGILCAQNVPAAETVRAEGRYTSTTLTDLHPFTSLEVNGDVKVTLRQLPTQTVTVSGRANLVALANIRVENDTLRIEYKRPIHIRGKDTLHVSVFMPQINALTARREGSIHVYGAVNTPELILTATDKGNIDIDGLTADTVRVQAMKEAEIDVEKLNTQILDATQSDKAQLDFSGYAENAQLVNNGRKDIEADTLRINHAHVAVNGHGDVEVFAVKTLKASANGSGEIKYHGAPVLTWEGNSHKIKPVFED